MQIEPGTSNAHVGYSLDFGKCFLAKLMTKKKNNCSLYYLIEK